MELTKSERFAKTVIELASSAGLTWREFSHGLHLAKEITKGNVVSAKCLENNVFPSQFDYNQCIDFRKP